MPATLNPEPRGNPIPRRWPRTVDEAFHTPAWRTPIEGPYRRARISRTNSHWWIAALVLLIVLTILGARAWAS
ncbi:MAG: hypothetical protein KDG57_21535 [Rhodoferax sp.]|nr:hypothetical protein [Rhodoferax sp.]